jgi:hypothetical protein
MLIPTGANDQRMTTNKRQTLVDFMFYSLCEGQGKAGAYGYSPLPLNLVQAGFEQVAKLGTADPGVDVANRDATKCNNPTFVAGDLSRNRLAEIAPSPADCDKSGAGPCLGAGQVLGSTGTGSAGSTAGSGSTGSKGTAAGTGGAAAGPAADGTGAAADGTGGDGAVTIDPETGLATGDAGGATTASGTVTSDIARPVGGEVAFAGLAAAELLAIVLVPGLLTLRARRRAAVRS